MTANGMTAPSLNVKPETILRTRQEQATREAEAHGHTLGAWQEVSVSAARTWYAGPRRVDFIDIRIGAKTFCTTCLALAQVRIAGGPSHGVKGTATTAKCTGKKQPPDFRFAGLEVPT